MTTKDEALNWKELETELIWAECSCTIVERTETREFTYKELEINE